MKQGITEEYKTIHLPDEIIGQHCNRVFAYQQCLKLLSEGTETL